MNKKILKFSLAAVLVTGCLSLGQADKKTSSTPAGVNVIDPPILVIDDWNDGVPPNNLGGGAGIFTDGGGGTSTGTFVSVGALGGTGYSMKIDYDVSAGESYAGYWTKFHPTVPRDLSNYKYLSFYVKGAVGEEFFKIELSTGAIDDGCWKSRVYITDYLDGGVTTNWQKVVIPLDNFANIVHWTNISEFTIVFEQSVAYLNDSAFAGTVYIDNLVVGSEPQGGVVRLDYYSDKVDVNALGGITNDFYTPPNSCSHNYSSLTSISPPYSLEINYNVSNSAAGNVGIFNIVGGGEDGAQKQPRDFSYYNQISFWVKANSDTENPEKLRIELKNPDGPDSDTEPDIRYFIVGSTGPLITTDWQHYTVLFSSFYPVQYSSEYPQGKSMLDPSAILECVFAIIRASAPDKIGKIYIDNVQFENSSYIVDTDSPTAPTILKLMDTDAGQAVADGTNFQWLNWLTCQAGNGLEDPTLESVRFEYQATGASTWTVIGFDYDVADNIYQTYWDTTGLSEGLPGYKLRAVARDTAGNESPTAATYTITITHYPNLSSMTDTEILDLIQKQIFWYYWTEINPDKGLIQDRARNFVQDTHGYTSIASVGMGLVAICVAHQRGWLNTTDAYNRVMSILKTYFNAPDPSKDPNLTEAEIKEALTNSPILLRYNGFYFHYTNFGGARRPGSELSTIDTTLFLAGALFAGKYFQSFGYNNPWNFADQMYRRVDWKWMCSGGEYLRWGWLPDPDPDDGTEAAHFLGEINAYSEGIFAYIMGIGSPEVSKQLPASLWSNIERPDQTYRDLSYVFEKALFTHQYPNLFVNFQGKKDSFACYAANTFKATIHHHRYAYDNRSIYSTYNENSWGLGGTDDLNVPNSYEHYGVGVIGVDNEGTIVLNNLLTAITERPRQVMQAIRYLYANFGAKLWGKYTFSDSYNTAFSQSAYFNETGMWRDPDVLGVQQGAVFLAIENYRPGLIKIKDTFTNISYIQDAFNRLSFVNNTIPPAPITDLQASMVSGKVVLSWTAPGDDDNSGDISDGIYEIRFSTNSLDTWDTAADNYLAYNIIWSTNVVAGSAQSRIILGLGDKSTYYFWIKTADDYFNWSTLSNGTSVYVPRDDAPPAKISNLQSKILQSAVQLTWTAPGDDGIYGNINNGKYEIKYTTVAAQVPGYAPYSVVWSTNTSPDSSENRIIESPLIPLSTHYFWIRTADEANNWSELSNKTTSYVGDIVKPSTIVNLTAITDFQVKLSWTAPGDDGSVGQANKYILKYSTMANIITESDWSKATIYPQNWLPSTSGTAETKVLTGLPPGALHYFSIRAMDNEGNIGGTSNTTENSCAPGYFVLYNSSLGGDAFAFGDVDNDGDLDLVVSGVEPTEPDPTSYIKIYLNGGGNYSKIQELNRGGAGIAWLDYDRDGSMDLVVIPGYPYHPEWDFNACLYHNGGGVFTPAQSFPQYDNIYCGLDVADYDNDGDMDIAFTGWGAGLRTNIWRNDNGVFSNMLNLGLTQVQHSNLAFGDYENDGDMDVGLIGWFNSAYKYLRIGYNNNGSSFTVTTASTYTGFNEDAGLAWGDYDNDGYLDLAVGGSYICRNNNKVFGKTSFSSASGRLMAAWGDYDNDGDLDVLLGDKLYKNSSGVFSAVQDIPGGRRAAWGDFNNDGALDFITSNGLYKNVSANFGVINSSPSAPTTLWTTVNGSTVTFKWDGGNFDVETSSAGLYYNIRVGNVHYVNPGNDNIISGNFGTPLLGNHLRPKISNTQFGRILKSLTPGTTYYWSVQTIDTGLRKSEWSAEQSVYVP